MADGSGQAATPMQAAQGQASKVDMGWKQAQTPPTLASFVGEDMAKNITTLSGDKGVAALVKSLQAAGHGDEATRTAEWTNFMRETMANLKTVKGDEQEKIVINAAAALDKATHGYDRTRLTAEQGLKQGLENRDKVNAILVSPDKDSPDKVAEKDAAKQLERSGYGDFFARADVIIQEAFQNHASGDPRIDPALPNKKGPPTIPQR
jgi:hypothetical protein